MQVSEKPKILVSVFPSGRSVISILKDGKTVSHTFPTSFEYEEILKEVSECETQFEVKERVWNERMFQISDSALISVEADAAIGPRPGRPSKPKKNGLLSMLKRFVARD